jgi:hypothetical protein
MSTKVKVKRIRPLDGFSTASDATVVSRGTAVQTNMTGNSNFPNPPVDLAAGWCCASDSVPDSFVARAVWQYQRRIFIALQQNRPQGA